MTYTVTLTTLGRKPMQAGYGPPTGAVAGTGTLSSTDNTATTTPALQGLFRTGGPLYVICDGISSLGYVIRWDATNHIFRAYQSTAAGSPLAEVATNTNAGIFNFVAWGQMG